MTDTRDEAALLTTLRDTRYIGQEGMRYAAADHIATLSRQLAEAQGVIERCKRVVDNLMDLTEGYRDTTSTLPQLAADIERIMPAHAAAMGTTKEV